MTGRTIFGLAENFRFSNAGPMILAGTGSFEGVFLLESAPGEPNARPLAGFLPHSLGGIAVSETQRARAKIVGRLDNSQRLSPEQQAQWVAKLHQVEFREPDMPSELLGAGVWIAYAALALVWLHGVAHRRTFGWLTTVCARVVAPLVPAALRRGGRRGSFSDDLARGTATRFT